MSGPAIWGTFAASTQSTVGSAAVISDVVDIPSGFTSAKLNLTGCDASNTVKTQKNTVAGGAWVDQITYNSNQTDVAITVSGIEQWRIVCVAQQAGKEIRYKFSCES